MIPVELKTDDGEVVEGASIEYLGQNTENLHVLMLIRLRKGDVETMKLACEHCFPPNSGWKAINIQTLIRDYGGWNYSLSFEIIGVDTKVNSAESFLKAQAARIARRFFTSKEYLAGA